MVVHCDGEEMGMDHVKEREGYAHVQAVLSMLDNRSADVLHCTEQMERGGP